MPRAMGEGSVAAAGAGQSLVKGASRECCIWFQVPSSAHSISEEGEDEEGGEAGMGQGWVQGRHLTVASAPKGITGSSSHCSA